MAPAAAAVEARLRETVDAQAATPAEAAFAQRYAARLRGVLDALRQPAAGVEPAADALRLLRALSDSLAQRLGCAVTSPLLSFFFGRASSQLLSSAASAQTWLAAVHVVAVLKSCTAGIAEAACLLL